LQMFGDCPGAEPLDFTMMQKQLNQQWRSLQPRLSRFGFGFGSIV
jgi:hypothetical protein